MIWHCPQGIEVLSFFFTSLARSYLQTIWGIPHKILAILSYPQHLSNTVPLHSCLTTVMVCIWEIPSMNIITILTHLTYRANAKKRVISNDIVTVLKARGKRWRQLLLQNDFNRGVRRCNVVFTLFTLHIHVYVCDTVQLLAGFLQCNGGKLEEAEDFKCVSSFIVR